MGGRSRRQPRDGSLVMSLGGGIWSVVWCESVQSRAELENEEKPQRFANDNGQYGTPGEMGGSGGSSHAPMIPRSRVPCCTHVVCRRALPPSTSLLHGIPQTRRWPRQQTVVEPHKFGIPSTERLRMTKRLNRGRSIHGHRALAVVESRLLELRDWRGGQGELVWESSQGVPIGEIISAEGCSIPEGITHGRLLCCGVGRSVGRGR
ncbi:hypothetical protein QBC39DRAFT_48197 [Podospora conica]|nr:hypothetical protein QBC39DRAFT_48197 [Schizothecium conicum]